MRKPVPAYAQDSQWRVLATNIARLNALAAKNGSELSKLKSLHSPTTNELQRLQCLTPLVEAQRNQALAWKLEQQDIETRYKMKKKP